MLLSKLGFLVRRPLCGQSGKRGGEAVTQGPNALNAYIRPVQHTTTTIQTSDLALPFAAVTDERASHVSRSTSMMQKAAQWVVSTT